MKKQEAGYKFLFKNSRLRRARNSGVAIYIASFSQELSARSWSIISPALPRHWPQLGRLPSVA